MTSFFRSIDIMAKSSGRKLALFALVALIGGAAGFGYFKQTAKLEDAPKTEESVVIERDALKAKPTDIILGDVNALITMVEYSSLSCPHCAHFHEEVLPKLEKEFIETGKVKLVMRHFPLNESAIRGAQIVECADQNNLSRENFLKVLFKMQAQWAFSDKFLEDLRKISLVGGMDSAGFDSCIADKELENRLIAGRQEAETKLHVNSTPTFFINGLKYEGEPTIEGFRTAITTALEPTK
jgi:protein-disulfide isomerase